MCPDVVILSHAADAHALAVLATLSSKTKPLLLDVGREGEAFTTVLSDDGKLIVTTRDSHVYDLTQVGFWWNRRPQFRAQTGTSLQFSSAQEIEATHFWMGVFGQASGGLWCNSMDAHVVARNKLRQVFTARECGLATPKTLWSNDPDAISEFYQVHDGCAIIKMYEGTENVWQPTRILTPEIIANKQGLRYAHSIVQAFVGGSLEHRVVIFGDDVFVVSTDVGESRYPFDVRIDTKAQRTAGAIKDCVVAKLKRYMEKTGLTFAAFDLRDDTQGESVFLEVNPMGQFLYMDNVLDGAVLKAFCRWIEQHPTKAPKVDPQDDAAIGAERWLGAANLPYFSNVEDHIVHLM